MVIRDLSGLETQVVEEPSNSLSESTLEVPTASLSQVMRFQAFLIMAPCHAEQVVFTEEKFAVTRPTQ
jgi:hypothetical protein